MKVLFIHSAYKFKGGEDTVVSEEIELLKANGVSVELLPFNNATNSLLKILQLPFNVSSYNTTRRKLKNFNPDIVHIHNLHFAASASVLYAIKKSKTPFVITLHNYRFVCPSAILYHNGKLFLDSITENFPWTAVKHGLYKNSRLLTLWISFSMQVHKWLGTWKMCNRFIVLSDFAKDIFMRSRLNLHDQQFAVKPNFCTVPEVEETERQDFFLYVGRLSEEKGILVLLEAFAATKAKIKIAGDGPRKEEVLKAASEHPNIEYLGTLQKNEVFFLLKQTSALVFPSICFEGMPLTIIEAFACGTPVIASKLGAMESMVVSEYNGLHFKPESATDLLYEVEKWQATNQPEKSLYSLNALESYNRLYTPQKNFEKLLLIYNEALGVKTFATSGEKKRLYFKYLEQFSYNNQTTSSAR